MKSLIAVVDDDPTVSRSLQRLLRAHGFEVECFESAHHFLKCERKPDCILLDINMPEMSGLELQNELNIGKINTPIIFLTGSGQIPESVQAIKAGAIDFLPKPFEEAALLDAIGRALEAGRKLTESEEQTSRTRRKLHELTEKEYEVFTYVITGIPNKAIAEALGSSEKTIKVHRGRIMAKLGASSIVELVRFADNAGVRPAEVTA
ncbi:response regulator transcription factor [Pelagicoccus mobilis]|uniref:Response regulator transcription factor n=1 Tax=Pelagicoccus mobilis TaxID=415221 RepID=A0A934S138_9BACT|nr:response regulator [Pelagicoccus mobilis]MBK1877932.1 response regulator transcription factor [Pelagicoccus mobilis]